MTAMIEVNGEARALRAATVLELLRAEGLDPGRRGIAVAVNGTVVPRAEWSARRLEDEAWVEIVQAKTGG